MNKKYTIIGVLSALLIIGMGMGVVVSDNLLNPEMDSAVNTAAVANTQVRVNSTAYKFINPLLYSDNDKDDSTDLNNLSKIISSYISSTTKQGYETSASAYFRDLNIGRWTGVSEDDKYIPSSMLKVVTMLAAYKLAESNKDILNEKLMYYPEADANQYYAPNDGLKEGEYTLDDLIKYMIMYSDNAALNAILSDQRINMKFTEVYEAFRLPDFSAPVGTGYMSPKSYAVMFRSLFNASFFSWNTSERVLGLLASSTFNRGLVAGVPRDTAIAHKFGENTNIRQSDNAVIERELHDCGIVYFPKHPYLLCVMTRGNDFSKLEKVITGISRITWNYVGSTLYPTTTLSN